MARISAADPSGRRPRRDAEMNRERVLAAATTAMLREGLHVPLAIIAAEAGVGIGTLYRGYPDRKALFRALESRAYERLSKILDQISPQGLTGLEAVQEYLTQVLAIGNDLILPLRGGPALVDPDITRARQAILERLDHVIERGRADGTIRAAVNATDVVVFSSLIGQPLPHGPSWPLVAERQLAIFVNGLAASGPGAIPGPAMTRDDIEVAFTGDGRGET
jgi:AcrR family transcriptional regulator